MKAVLDRPARHSLDEARVDERVRELFARLPSLVGFSVGQGLWLVDVAIDPWPGCRRLDQLRGEVGAALATLVAEAEDDGAEELLRGRTFARAFH